MENLGKIIETRTHSHTLFKQTFLVKRDKGYAMQVFIYQYCMQASLSDGNAPWTFFQLNLVSELRQNKQPYPRQSQRQPNMEQFQRDGTPSQKNLVYGQSNSNFMQHPPMYQQMHAQPSVRIQYSIF